MTTEECAAMGQMMSGMMGQMSGMMGQMSGGMMGTGGAWGGTIWLGLLTLAVMVAVGVALVIVIARRPIGPVGEDPRAILRRRFALGELSADEFGEAMKTLG